MKKVISLIMTLVMWMGSLLFVVTLVYAATPKVEYSAHVSSIPFIRSIPTGSCAAAVKCSEQSPVVITLNERNMIYET